jgi:hypothetical protein
MYTLLLPGRSHAISDEAAARSLTALGEGKPVPSCEPHRFSPAFLGDVLAGLLDGPFRRASREVADLGLT